MWNLEIFSQQKVRALTELGRISFVMSHEMMNQWTECFIENDCRLSRNSSGGEDGEGSGMDNLAVGLAAC